ncbi:PREDICTED: solute carrier family 41 member 1-like [Nicrophorus vespilloides]|uniref:Solute carrier family 41 member 1-like n=1 Tax=Nicrophorus vespilloides TaxID=110193 RepID=A0ABM1MRD4_NICVS|nr:PREDICTED: solute carrier family 41 member 1-like [Nicrophorus vespilloides]XP_017777134.1 PREDICTED: solute carrier family 41 member 1-like [Nicrophorus vespilloides]XP_017777135.1 PREDICTED: solute carrier family 41 member 1-like [Nicrophorus vespilloides]XP_017777136.1 PREDICTED: solute carrier family 41 member 1-like [Nicrophorus vespilloides]
MAGNKDPEFRYTDTPDSTMSQSSLGSEQFTVSTILGLVDDGKDTDGVVIKVESLPNSNMGSTQHTNSSQASSDYILKKEKWYSVTLQIFIPFMIAGVGTIGAGVVLGNVQEHEVFRNVNALFILVPSILGLKGNLDMCLASRLSTQANLGNMTSKKKILKMIVGNISLVQVQAIVAACLVSVFAVSVSAVMIGKFVFNDAILLAASSVVTATVSCFILDLVLIAVITLAHHLKVNPDNLATPLAASIGDIVSLILLSTIAGLLYKIHDSHTWVLYMILGFYLLIALPLWVFVVRKNEYTRPILTHGWTPVLVALLISGLGGLVLDSAVDDYQGFVVFQPIINGIGGNLVSVQSSRISTMLHQTSLPGIFPPHTRWWVMPWTALFKGVFSAKTARMLIIMAIPGQTVFVFVADFIYNGVSTVTPEFVFTYLAVGLIQIMLLLYIAHLLTHTMWRWKIDPDNSAIPYLTALGDLLGSTLLFLAFMFLRSINREYQPII